MRGCSVAAIGVEGLADGLGFFIGEGDGRGTGLDGLGVEAGHGSAVQAAENDAIAPAVEERDGKALVAAGFLEGVEPDEADALDAALEGDTHALQGLFVNGEVASRFFKTATLPCNQFSEGRGRRGT